MIALASARLGRFFRRDSLGLLGAVLLLVLLILGIFGDLLPLGDPNAIGAGPRLGAPSLAFPLGTDDLGRSYLPRVVEGIGVTFLLSAIAVIITAVIGTLLGMAAGYLHGATDHLIARIADILFAFPALLFGLLAAAVIGPGSIAAIVVISTATIPLFIRVVRSVTLSVAEREFVVAAVVSGASTWRVMLVHLLPNILGAAIIQLTYALSVSMIIESALSFLGLGVQPPAASLGSLLRLGSVYLTIAPWLVLAPGLVLAAAIMSINLLGDAIRDALDPLRGRSLK
ncbi:ABC transporter permease [Oceanibacterium hippocampi]|uniref:Glutathione transport system permease protein GsiD n=1 Tax=Oceanibacterium hippocampi TaxID=745714 RepID=A0A1Y5TG13_9PROT|nr:ABC transporter permease [Oceanibacterium hippocampi]SLN63372.1 Glutathione transport system permease protein GsiD [Oceanibacterium hippocampi]